MNNTEKEILVDKIEEFLEREHLYGITFNILTAMQAFGIIDEEKVKHVIEETADERN